MDDNKQKKKLDPLDMVFGIACLLVMAVLITYWLNFKNNPISSEVGSWGAFGDYIGGTINPILGFFSFMALLITLDLQRKQLNKTEEQLELNREELILTRDELKKAADAQVDSAKVMNEQLKTQYLQQFDSLFFALLDQFSKKIYEFQNNLDKKGSFHSYHDIFNVKSFMTVSELRGKFELDEEVISIFVFLYQILKIVDEKLLLANIKKDYSNILRSLVPSKINKMLLINCASKGLYNIDKARQLLMNFEFFEHINFKKTNVHIFATQIHVISNYPIEVFGENKDLLKLHKSILIKEFQKTSNFYAILFSILQNTREFKKTIEYGELSFVKEDIGREMPISKFTFHEYSFADETYARATANLLEINNFSLEESFLYLQCANNIEYKLQLEFIESVGFSIDNIQTI